MYDYYRFTPVRLKPFKFFPTHMRVTDRDNEAKGFLENVICAGSEWDSQQLVSDGMVVDDQAWPILGKDRSIDDAFAMAAGAEDYKRFHVSIVANS